MQEILRHTARNGIKMFRGDDCICERCKSKINIDRKGKWCDYCLKDLKTELKELMKEGHTLKYSREALGLSGRYAELIMYGEKKRIREVKSVKHVKTWYEDAVEKLNEKKPNKLDFLKSKIKKA